jgi:hypothetical protein
MTVGQRITFMKSKMPAKVWLESYESSTIYEVVPIISGIGAAICTAVVLAWCNSRW